MNLEMSAQLTEYVENPQNPLTLLNLAKIKIADGDIVDAEKYMKLSFFEYQRVAGRLVPALQSLLSVVDMRALRTSDFDQKTLWALVDFLHFLLHFSQREDSSFLEPRTVFNLLGDAYPIHFSNRHLLLV